MKERSETEKLALSVKEAASTLGVHENTIWMMIHKGNLASIRAGRRVIVPKTSIERFLGGLDPVNIVQPPALKNDDSPPVSSPTISVAKNSKPASEVSDTSVPMRKKGRAGNGQGSVRERPDGTWEVRLSLPGPDGFNKIRRSVYGATQKEALAKARQLQAKKPQRKIGESQAEADPVPRALELLSAALSSGRAHLKAAQSPEDPPKNAAAWGWQKTAGEHSTVRWDAKGLGIGWLADNEVLLEPAAAYKVITEMAGQDPLGLGQPALFKAWAERGFLRRSGDGRPTVTARIAGRAQRVAACPLSVFTGPATEPANAPVPAASDQLVSQALDQQEVAQPTNQFAQETARVAFENCCQGMNTWLEAIAWLEVDEAAMSRAGSWVITYVLSDGMATYSAFTPGWPVPWLRWAAANLPPANGLTIRPNSTLVTKAFGLKPRTQD